MRYNTEIEKTKLILHVFLQGRKERLVYFWCLQRLQLFATNENSPAMKTVFLVLQKTYKQYTEIGQLGFSS